MNMRGISIRQIGQFRSETNLLRAMEGVTVKASPALVARRNRQLQREQDQLLINDAVDGILGIIGQKNG